MVALLRPSSETPDAEPPRSRRPPAVASPPSPPSPVSEPGGPVIGHPEPPPATPSPVLRLVVDNGPVGPRRAGYLGHRAAAEGVASRGASSVGTARSVRSRPGALFADPAVLVVVAVAVVVFGGLLFVRLSQSSPGAGTWDELEPTPADVGPPVTAANAGSANPGDGLITAGPGDSLWSIAERVAPGADPRPVVAALIEANGGQSVQIGQQIVIPRQLLD